MIHTFTTFRSLLGLSVVAVLLASCTSSRYASTTEYDDVYYSSSDRTERPAQATQREYSSPQDNYSYNADRNRQNRQVDNYGDYYYADDDFAFSRRIRRFNSAAPGANWRYYDPYFSNDLYFVMGTSYWNRWNNNGWYNWNSPRFGAYNYYDPFFNDPFFNPGWGGFNNYGYGTAGVGYNPWVGSFYGYNPGFGVGGFNRGFYNGYNAGFYNGFNSAYYCPPVGTFTGRNNNLWNSFAGQNTNTGRATVNRARNQSSGAVTGTRTPGRRSVRNNTAGYNTKTGTVSRTDYTRPRANTPTRVTRDRTGGTIPTRTTTRPSASPSSSRPSSTARPTRTTRPTTSSSTRRPTNTTRPARTTQPRTNVSPSSSRPSRTVRPSTSTPSRTYRPSSSSSSSRPSSSYRPSSSSRSSARPSSSSSRPSSSRPRRP